MGFFSQKRMGKLEAVLGLDYVQCYIAVQIGIINISELVQMKVDRH